MRTIDPWEDSATVVKGWLMCLGLAVASIDEAVFQPGSVPQLD